MSKSDANDDVEGNGFPRPSRKLPVNRNEKKNCGVSVNNVSIMAFKNGCLLTFLEISFLEKKKMSK